MSQVAGSKRKSSAKVKVASKAKSPRAQKTPVDPETAMRPIWKAYKTNPTPQLRNTLVEHYLPLVHKCATRLQKTLPAVVQLDDLIGAGNLGLLDAIESFQIDRDIKFATFSALRIRGAILDELRALDWTPRTTRTTARRLDAAATALRSELERLPSDEEMADRLGMPVKEYRKLSRDSRSVSFTSLSRPRDENGAEPETGDSVSVADERAADPVHESQRRALKAHVTRGLSRAERLLVTLYYYEDLTMREVGQVLDLSESRVSQMHTQIVRRLRAAVRTDRETMSELEAA